MDFRQAREGTLDAVEHGSKEPRPQLDRERLAGRENRRASGEPGGFFIDLQCRRLALELDDLAEQAFVANEHDFTEHHIAEEIGPDDGA